MHFANLDRQFQAQAPDILDAVKNVLSSGHYINGTAVEELESTLARYLNVPHAIGCASGTDALLLSLLALDLPPGSEVITSAFGFIATAEVILRAGFRPVFVDIDPRTYNLKPENIEQALTDRTRAILPASLFGYSVDMTAIQNLADKLNLHVIEDGSQSLGAPGKDEKKVCGQSKLACVSFFPTKPLGCYGDGGMVFTNDSLLAENIRLLKNHGFNKTGASEKLGMNSRLDTLQAAILLAKWPRFHEEMHARRQIARFYIQHFSHIPGIVFPAPKMVERHVFSQFTIECSFRDALKNHLEKKGVPSAVYYPVPLPQYKPFHFLKYSAEAFPNAQRAAARVLSLPINPYLTPQEQERIFESVLEFMGEVNKRL